MNKSKLQDHLFDMVKQGDAVSVKVVVDPTRWGVRKRNIVMRALDNGYIDAGWGSILLVNALAKAHGLSLPYLSRGVYFHDNHESRCADIAAYAVAAARMDSSSPSSWWLRRRESANAYVLDWVCLPAMSKPERTKLLCGMIKRTDAELELAARLRKIVEDCKPIEIMYDFDSIPEDHREAA